MDSKTSDLLSLRKDQLKSLRDIAIESLREAIVSGLLKPGEHLKERELSRRMGISTTPVKEALRVLGNEGWVVTVPRRGSFVSEVVDSTIEESQTLRAYLEGLCARLAAEKIDDAQLEELGRQLERMERLYEDKHADELVNANTVFHERIREAARNPMIANMLVNLSAFDTPFRKRALQMPIEWTEGLREHRAIYEAIRGRDAEQAEARMKSHILRTARSVLRHS